MAPPPAWWRAVAAPARRTARSARHSAPARAAKPERAIPIPRVLPISRYRARLSAKRVAGRAEVAQGDGHLAQAVQDGGHRGALPQERGRWPGPPGRGRGPGPARRADGPRRPGRGGTRRCRRCLPACAGWPDSPRTRCRPRGGRPRRWPACPGRSAPRRWSSPSPRARPRARASAKASRARARSLAPLAHRRAADVQQGLGHARGVVQLPQQGQAAPRSGPAPWRSRPGPRPRPPGRSGPAPRPTPGAPAAGASSRGIREGAGTRRSPPATCQYHHRPAPMRRPCSAPAASPAAARRGQPLQGQAQVGPLPVEAGQPVHLLRAPQRGLGRAGQVGVVGGVALPGGVRPPWPAPGPPGRRRAPSPASRSAARRQLVLAQEALGEERLQAVQRVQGQVAGRVADGPRRPPGCSPRRRRRGAGRGPAPAGLSRSWLQARAARTVWCRAGSSRRPPTRRSRRCSRRERMACGGRARLRAAASSMARGSPSRRRQTSATAGAISGSSRKSGRTSWARCTNSATAGAWSSAARAAPGSAPALPAPGGRGAGRGRGAPSARAGARGWSPAPSGRGRRPAGWPRPGPPPGRAPRCPAGARGASPAESGAGAPRRGRCRSARRPRARPTAGRAPSGPATAVRSTNHTPSGYGPLAALLPGPPPVSGDSARDSARDGQGEAGLPRPGGAGEGEQAHPFLEQPLAEGLHLDRAPDEARRLRGQDGRRGEPVRGRRHGGPGGRLSVGVSVRVGVHVSVRW